MKHEKEIVGFNFQEIPLDEAVNAVIAGDGNYAGLKAKLLEVLPTIAADKAFAFGYPGGKEVPEEERRGICMALNSTLKKTKIAWRVTYSSLKSLFVCVPSKTPRTYEKHDKDEYTPRSKYNEVDDGPILELWKKGMSVSEIIEQLGADRERVKYVCYQKNPRKHVDTNPEKKSEPLSINATNIFTLAEKTFGETDFTTRNARAYRKAISVVGVKHLGIHPRELEPRLGISASGISFNANQQNPFGAKEIKLLLKSVKGGA